MEQLSLVLINDEDVKTLVIFFKNFKFLQIILNNADKKQRNASVKPLTNPRFCLLIVFKCLFLSVFG